MDNRPIGIFDSGIGGLTSVREFSKILPNEDIIYFGDTARIPYGTRSKETVMKYALQDISFLLEHDVKMIVAACGTVSAILPQKITQEFDFLFTGVLLPAVQSACVKTKNGNIGVIGTPATIRSGSYGRAIRSINPNATIIGNACPLFVPLIENGYTNRDNEVTRLVARQYLEPFIKAQVDTLILGCTHYPIIEDIIADIMGENCALISPGACAAKFAQGILTQEEKLKTDGIKGKRTYYASDSIELFSENAKSLLGEALDEEAIKIDIDLIDNLII